MALLLPDVNPLRLFNESDDEFEESSLPSDDNAFSICDDELFTNEDARICANSSESLVDSVVFDDWELWAFDVCSRLFSNSLSNETVNPIISFLNEMAISIHL